MSINTNGSIIRKIGVKYLSPRNIQCFSWVFRCIDRHRNDGNGDGCRKEGSQNFFEFHFNTFFEKSQSLSIKVIMDIFS